MAQLVEVGKASRISGPADSERSFSVPGQWGVQD